AGEPPRGARGGGDHRRDPAKGHLEGADVGQVARYELDPEPAQHVLAWGSGTDEPAHQMPGPAQQTARLATKEPGGSDDQDGAHNERTSLGESQIVRLWGYARGM